MGEVRELRPLPEAPRTLAPGGLEVDPRVLEACRLASLNLAGPLLKSLGVTSTLRGEGRTTVALAMALVQAREYGRSTILIDMDSADGAGLAQRLGIAESPGLADFLLARAGLGEIIRRVPGKLAVITAGESPDGLLPLLMDAFRAGLMNDLAAAADVVVADLPPLLEGGVARVAATSMERLLVVVRAGVTRRSQVEAATDRLPPETVFLLNETDSRVPRWIRRIAGG